MKILDFQGYNYNSFVFDLLQFLFYNVRIDHLRMHFKSFVEYYLLEFANVMRIANCPLDDYTNEKLDCIHFTQSILFNDFSTFNFFLLQILGCGKKSRQRPKSIYCIYT